MLENNELIWKLLKHNNPEAYKEGNLTASQKRGLIYKGEDNETDFRVFMDVGQSDAWLEESCVLRISPFRIIPTNRTVGTVQMAFEVYAHYKINHLTNYKTRINVICEELIALFNGVHIGGIGKLFFDVLEDRGLGMIQVGQIPFKGKRMLMSTKTA